jgi:hypothetical protein
MWLTVNLVSGIGSSDWQSFCILTNGASHLFVLIRMIGVGLCSDQAVGGYC